MVGRLRDRRERDAPPVRASAAGAAGHASTPDRARRAIERLYRLATGLAFAVLIAAVAVQVIGRLGGVSPVWTEELTRYALLYLAAFGVGLSYRSGDLVNVDLVCESLPGRWPWRLRLLAAVATATLCAVLLAPAWLYTSIGVRQTSPALGWRMDLVHASVLVLLVSLLLFAALRVVDMLSGRSEGLPHGPASALPGAGGSAPDPADGPAGGLAGGLAGGPNGGRDGDPHEGRGGASGGGSGR